MTKNTNHDASITDLLEKNKRSVKDLAGEEYDTELGALLAEIFQNFFRLYDDILAKMASGWHLSDDPESARKERHDLYGHLTEVNYGLEAAMMLHETKLATEHVACFRDILATNRELYRLIKATLTPAES